MEAPVSGLLLQRLLTEACSQGGHWLEPGPTSSGLFPQRSLIPALVDVADMGLLYFLLLLFMVLVVLVAVCVYVFPFLGFAGVELSVSCVFMGVASFLGLEFSS